MEKDDIYEKKVEAQYDEWKARMNMIQAKINQADAEARLKHKDIINSLKSNWDVFKNKMSDFKNDNAEAVDEIKTGINDALDELDSAFEKAKSKFIN